MKRLAMLATLCTLAACVSLPAPAPALTQHDLGGVFPAGDAKSPVPLRAIQVLAQPVLATAAMQYREAAQPTRRASFALNRWAAPPASMLENALTRLLATDGVGRCRLQIALSEFIIDIDAQGKARAVLAADASLLRDTPAAIAHRSFDISVPMNEASPAAGALGLREATFKLSQSAASWLGSNEASSCKS